MSKFTATLTAAQGAGLVAWSFDTAQPATTLNLDITAHAMLLRSTRRRANGHVRRKARKARIVGVAMTGVVFLSLVGAGFSIFFPADTGGDASAPNTAEQGASIAVVVAMGLVLIFVIKLSLLVQWYFYWLALAVVALLIVNKGKLVPSPSTSPTPSTGLSRIFDPHTGPTFPILLTMLIVQSLTLIATLVRRSLYPLAVARLTPQQAVSWWRVRPIRLQPGTFQYTLYDPWTLSTDQRTFSYTGSVNPHGQPHGHGVWCDDADSGEVTTGWWREGVLDAPFSAREFGSGDSFGAVRIGFVTCAALGPDEYRWRPEVDRRGVRYGVASVECSVSGKFFAELPQVSYPVPPKYRDEIIADLSSDVEPGISPQPMRMLLRELDNHEFTARPAFSRGPAEQFQSPTPTDLGETGGNPRNLERVVVSVDQATGLPFVVGCRRVDGQTADPTSLIVKTTKEESGRMGLSVDGWVPDPTPKPHPDRGTSLTTPRQADEALIFIHGFNCSLTAAQTRLAQLLTLGNFPAHIKPLIFAWPSGRELTYFSAIRMGAHSAIKEAFMGMVRELREAGVRRCHLVAHSAGCRLAVGFAGGFGEVFTRLGEEENGKMELGSYTLINGDVPLTDFLSTHYPAIRQYCALITTYVDENDGALFWAEVVCRTKVLGRNPGAVYTVVPMREEEEGEEEGEGEEEWMGEGSSVQLMERAPPTPSNDSTARKRGKSVLDVDTHPPSRTPTQQPLWLSNRHRTTGFLQVKHPWQDNHKASGGPLKFMQLARFGGFWKGSNSGNDSPSASVSSPLTPSTPSPPSQQHKPHHWERKYERIHIHMQEEITRLQELMRGREQFAKIVTDHDGVRGSAHSGRQRRYMIYPDCDTIDTSLLDVNIHSLRHNYFNLNRMFVDDLLDIIVHGKRAEERTARLAHTIQGGLVYQFLCAPSYVVNP
ncbi:uncharacterized protein EV422DRAFT_604716 [Fimicolochytrium jonesii]|uniref:uncharacterized protein n=1 Tax=Fimicolochytrium jonesii TaxID=1396493 RepID=UPI0022FDCDF4|nr:uncharacterized protein EV422DRAFT_604716 [Fimicolochytrium jonesii]KAI8817476.1 hypothetical protein EV422DRAFT_604716 [Fimicolochytrium jonesii]